MVLRNLRGTNSGNKDDYRTGSGKNYNRTDNGKSTMEYAVVKGTAIEHTVQIKNSY